MSRLPTAAFLMLVAAAPGEAQYPIVPRLPEQNGATSTLNQMAANARYREAQDRAWEKAHPGRTRAQVAEENWQAQREAVRATTNTLRFAVIFGVVATAAGFFAYWKFSRAPDAIDPAKLAASDPWVRQQLAREQRLPGSEGTP